MTIETTPPLATLPRRGACRCGYIRFQITGPELITAACHCTGCQRMTSSAFSLSVMVPEEAFRITEGEPVAGGLEGSPHLCCPSCMSWLFPRLEPGRVINVRATLLDDAADFVPFMESFTDEKLPWVVTPAVRSFPRFPGSSEYQELMAAFTTWAQAGR